MAGGTGSPRAECSPASKGQPGPVQEQSSAATFSLSIGLQTVQDLLA